MLLFPCSFEKFTSEHENYTFSMRTANMPVFDFHYEILLLEYVQNEVWHCFTEQTRENESTLQNMLLQNCIY